jgi:predicted enzyme related to lactoylglutathione lyase
MIADRPVLRGIRSVIVQVDDLEKAKTFYSAALGRTPYFDQPFYAGYDVDGQELGLHPDVSKIKPGPGGAIAYWKVDDIAASWDHLLALGGGAIEAPHDVGGDIKTAIVADPFGNLIGLIQIAT